ncbi:MAG: hypothetical protein ABEI06_10715 [Halobacteriaceae archaeon]
MSPSEIVDTLTSLHILEKIRFTVDDERITALAHMFRNDELITNDEIIITASEIGGPRLFRVIVEGKNGEWSHPKVFFYDTSTSSEEWGLIGDIEQFERILQ